MDAVLYKGHCVDPALNLFVGFTLIAGIFSWIWMCCFLRYTHQMYFAQKMGVLYSMVTPICLIYCRIWMYPGY